MIPEKYFSVNGIVLKCSDFSESSRILTLFSDEYGLIKVSAKAVKRKDSKLLPVTQPLSFGRYQLCRGKNDLHTLTSGELIENFYGISKDIDRFTAAGEMTGELLKNLVPEEPEPDVLRLYLNSLFTLCYSEKEISFVRPVFTLRLKYELGFLADPEAVIKKYVPDANKVTADVLEHIINSDLKQLYGFTVSDDIKRTIGILAEMVRSEDK